MKKIINVFALCLLLCVIAGCNNTTIATPTTAEMPTATATQVPTQAPTQAPTTVAPTTKAPTTVTPTTVVPTTVGPNEDGVVSITEALSIIEGLTVPADATEVYTETKYTITGKITGTYGSYWYNYGSFTINDGTDEIVIYGSYSADGSIAYKNMVVKPKVNDTVTVIGTIGKYTGGETPVSQIKNGWIIDLVQDPSNTVTTVDPSTVEAADHVVIYEVYGGGGNKDSVYSYDYVILYNPTDATVSLEGWTIQYASSSNAFSSLTTLAGSIESQGYYLIQAAKGSKATGNLPVTPDVTSEMNISATGCKIALVNGTTIVLSPTAENVIDLVGIGYQASFYEGSAPTDGASNGLSVKRTNFGDSNDNKADFATATPDLSYLTE